MSDHDAFKYVREAHAHARTVEERNELAEMVDDLALVVSLRNAEIEARNDAIIALNRKLDEMIEAEVKRMPSFSQYMRAAAHLSPDGDTVTFNLEPLASPRLSLAVWDSGQPLMSPEAWDRYVDLEAEKLLAMFRRAVRDVACDMIAD